MENNFIFLPVLVQIGLTIGLYIYLASAKSKAFLAGQVDEKRRGLHNDAWPDSVLKINNCIRNQFEVPVLFYVLIIALFVTQNINLFIHIMAWLFVITRLIHAKIHTGSNFVPLRKKYFMVGCLTLLGLSVYLAIKLLMQ